MEITRSNCWKEAERFLNIKNIRCAFSAYGWIDTADYKVSKEDHWSGWWNDYYNFVMVWPKTKTGKAGLERMRDAFISNGWDVRPCINGGYSFGYSTMTAEESRAKADRNLANGGRMSD